MSSDDISNILKDRTVTYAQMVVDYRPKKDDPNRVRMTSEGNLIKYPGELTTCMEDLTTSKIMRNSVYMCIDIKNFYLGTPLDRFEYMRITLSMFTKHVIQQYHL